MVAHIHFVQVTLMPLPVYHSLLGTYTEGERDLILNNAHPHSQLAKLTEIE